MFSIDWRALYCAMVHSSERMRSWQTLWFMSNLIWGWRREMSSNFSLKHGDLAQTVAVLCTLLNRHLGQLGTRWGHMKLRGTFLVLVSVSLECFQPLPFQGWCNNCGPCESDVKASLPFHGALLWPFHRVKPKEIHVHDLCGASLHSGTVRREKKWDWEWKGHSGVHTGHVTLEL